MKVNSMIKIGAVLLAAVILLSICITPAFARVSAPELKQKQTDKPAIVFLVAGQSNAGGCGVISSQVHKKLGRHKRRPLVPGSTAVEVGLPVDAADYTHSYMRVPKQGFQRTDPKINVRPIEMNGNWHGMELPVIRELEKRFPENDIYVVKYGPSGTNLHHQWNPKRPGGLYATWLGKVGNQWRLYYNGWTRVSKTRKRPVGAEHAIGLAFTKDSTQTETGKETDRH